MPLYKLIKKFSIDELKKGVLVAMVVHGCPALVLLTLLVSQNQTTPLPWKGQPFQKAEDENLQTHDGSLHPKLKASISITGAQSAMSASQN
jgi:hypothetical protein